jgi:CBS domain-containing protein
MMKAIIEKQLVCVKPDELALTAFQKMRLTVSGRVAVVDPENPKKLVGVLTKTDLTHILRDKI